MKGYSTRVEQYSADVARGAPGVEGYTSMYALPTREDGTVRDFDPADELVVLNDD